MPSQDAEALAELARLCSEVRATLPDSGSHRLRVLLDMILVELAPKGFPVEAAAPPKPARIAETPRPYESP